MTMEFVLIDLLYFSMYKLFYTRFYFIVEMTSFSLSYRRQVLSSNFFLHLNLTQRFWKFFNVNWFIYKFSINNYVTLLCVIKYNFLFMREIKKLVKLYSYCIQCSRHKQNAWCGSVTPVPPSFKHLKFSNHLTQSFTYIF